MMLTDRQNKFLNRMVELNKEDSSATNKEKVYLNRSINEIKNGTKFKYAINSLNLSIREMRKRKKPLTSEVDKLSRDLIEAYGEPGYGMGMPKVNSDDGTYITFGPW